MAMKGHSILAEIYINPWLALLSRREPFGERFLFALMSSMAWLMSIALIATAGLLVGVVVDLTGQPTERREAVVVRRVWRPTTDTLSVQPVITTSGQITTVMVSDRDPERYEVCLQIDDQQPCALRYGRLALKASGLAQRSPR
ncbi:hypothetical protein EBE87_23115 [Pseudoroseomonas wenyumeiae]|uniref:Uncharacterized protein n=1 Tax=Teichococcus wenyumeiae TaxID=2478470 RepID=A0A3A9JV62_9PROT|nr:hypothetical protein [Pseudoroseomonas wenyumeiae]RKK04678.1 hypothetical protein D6Z83_08195 [Pseudoroseomonas wenyumeiae]RMI17319.1 hypothetical protein EBE87_23115 [Pseudoroseomonas wenyumeiae]